MPEPIRQTLIALSFAFIAVGVYHRILAAQSGESLDRRQEGWPILIGMRLAGLATFGSAAVWLWNPSWFAWAAVPMPEWARWIGVAGFACTVVWLMWMFHTLGPNLTDTVVTRRAATFVDHGPYRYVSEPDVHRNPDGRREPGPRPGNLAAPHRWHPVLLDSGEAHAH